jgi:hypothetical protein
MSRGSPTAHFLQFLRPARDVADKKGHRGDDSACQKNWNLRLAQALEGICTYRSASGIGAAGIKPDMIAGSSMGAVIGGIYSAGTDLDLLEKFITSISLYGYLDLNLPLSPG